MNILLIAPATGPWRHIGRRKSFNGKTFRFSHKRNIARGMIAAPNSFALLMKAKP